MLSSLSNSLPAQVCDLNAFLFFRSVQFNPTLAQQSKYWQSSNLTSYIVPAFLCFCKSLNEGAKSLRAKLFSWQCLLLSHMEQSRYTLPATVLTGGRSNVFKVCYEDLVRQPLIDLSGSCAGKSSPFENIPNLLCIWTGEKLMIKSRHCRLLKLYLLNNSYKSG